MTEYDLELIIDKEGTEGLTKIYASLQKDIAETPANKLGFLEKDFTSDYFDARANESSSYLGLNSLFENEIAGHEEDVKTKFRRKETLLKDMEKADDTFMDVIDYNSTASDGYKTLKKAMLHLQMLDHCLDVLTFKHALDLACAKGNAENLKEPDIKKIIEDYSSVLKTYIENKKFNKKSTTDEIRIINTQLNDTTCDSLENILSRYNVNDEQTLKHFQALKDKILENKETSFLSMFEEGKRYGAFYWKQILFGAGVAPFLLGGFTFYIGCVTAAAKQEAFFSNYIVGGALGALAYLTARYYATLFNVTNNIYSRTNQKLVYKNEDLKKAIINKKKSFSEPLP